MSILFLQFISNMLKYYINEVKYMNEFNQQYLIALPKNFNYTNEKLYYILVNKEIHIYKESKLIIMINNYLKLIKKDKSPLEYQRIKRTIYSKIIKEIKTFNNTIIITDDIKEKIDINSKYILEKTSTYLLLK